MIDLFNSLSENNRVVLINSLLVVCLTAFLGGLGYFGKMWFGSEKTNPPPVSQTASQGGIIQNSDKGKNIANTGSGSIYIGISLEQYEQGLKRREVEVRQALKQAHAEERQWLAIELQAIQTTLQSSQTSYENHIADLKQRIVQLESLRGQLSDTILDQAKTALAQGQSQQADALFKRIEEQADSVILVAAEAAYQRGKIAQDAIYYLQALNHYERAARLFPENSLYLNQAGVISHTLGNYQQVPISNLTSFGEAYPKLAFTTPNETRIALVIGNSNYSITPLVNSVNDARAMSRVLMAAGFKVEKYEDLGQKAMKKAIVNFGRKLPRYDISLFYYAGHGVQVKGRNYLIPVDVKIEYESDIEIETVDLAMVLSKMGKSKDQTDLVILDACHNNHFTSNIQSLSQGLAFTSAPSGTLIAYATAPGDTVIDWYNGVYTKFLIKHVLTPGKKIEDIFKQVRVDVQKETQDSQIPWESSSLEGSFYFFP